MAKDLFKKNEIIKEVYDTNEYKIFNDRILDFLDFNNQSKTMLIDGEYGSGKTKYIKWFMENNKKSYFYNELKTISFKELEFIINSSKKFRYRRFKNFLFKSQFSKIVKIRFEACIAIFIASLGVLFPIILYFDINPILSKTFISIISLVLIVVIFIIFFIPSKDENFIKKMISMPGRLLHTNKIISTFGNKEKDISKMNEKKLRILVIDDCNRYNLENFSNVIRTYYQIFENTKNIKIIFIGSPNQSNLNVMENIDFNKYIDIYVKWNISTVFKEQIICTKLKIIDNNFEKESASNKRELTNIIQNYNLHYINRIFYNYEYYYENPILKNCNLLRFCNLLSSTIKDDRNSIYVPGIYTEMEILTLRKIYLVDGKNISDLEEVQRRLLLAWDINNLNEYYKILFFEKDIIVMSKVIEYLLKLNYNSGDYITISKSDEEISSRISSNIINNISKKEWTKIFTNEFVIMKINSDQIKNINDIWEVNLDIVDFLKIYCLYNDNKLVWQQLSINEIVQILANNGFDFINESHRIGYKYKECILAFCLENDFFNKPLIEKLIRELFIDEKHDKSIMNSPLNKHYEKIDKIIKELMNR